MAFDPFTDPLDLGLGGFNFQDANIFGSYDGNPYDPPSNFNAFGNFLDQLGSFGPASNPIGAAQQAGNQLAYNLGQSANTAAIAAQGLGIKGQMLGAGTALLGEDAQLNRETNAILRGQQLNQTNLAREANAQNFKARMAGSMSPMAIARASRMAYGI